MIVEDGETTVVRETSVDSCEPVDWLSVNLVTRRVMYNSVLTARLCSHNAQSYLLNKLQRSFIANNTLTKTLHISAKENQVRIMSPYMDPNSKSK